MSKQKKSFINNKHARQTQSGTSVPLKLNLRVLAGVAILALTVFIAYFPSINGGFIWDDVSLLTKNLLVKASGGLHRIWCTTDPIDYWPMTNTSFWIEWRLWETNPIGYHVTNIMLHIVEALLIWVSLRKLSIPGAFLAAIVFAMHPVNVESVAWIAQRKNTLTMLFFLLSILWYLKADMHKAIAGIAPARSHGEPWELDKIRSPLSIPHAPLWYRLSLAAFMLAMLSKGSAAVLPVLLLGIIWWRRRLTKRDCLRTAPFFIVAAVLTLVNICFQSRDVGESIRYAGFLERLLGAGVVIWFYLYKALLPIDLAFIYPQWQIQTGNPLWWPPLSAALLITAVLWCYRKKWSKPFLFAWGFFCVALIPVMGITYVFFMRYSPVADHYQHIAIIGVITLTVTGWSIWHQRVRGILYWGTTLVTIVAVGVLTLLTWRQSGLYSDESTLFQETLEKNPGCWMAHTILGIISLNKGQLPEAIAHQREAVRLNPDFFEAQNNLGSALAKAGRPQEAIEHYKRATELNPYFLDAHYNLGIALFNVGRLQEAIDQYQQALRINPNFPDAQNNLGSALARAGRPQEAIEHYQRALELNPNFFDAHYNLGVILFNVDRLPEAIHQYEQALRINPNFPEAHNYLGLALANGGRLQEAIIHYQQALQLSPDYIEAHNNLGAALAQTGRHEEAIEHFEQALRLKPDFTNVYYNLALLYARMQQSSQAIAAAQKALELARSQGQGVQAKQIEDWLNAYRLNLSNFPNVSPSSESNRPAH
ncbi:MAG: tetratricopeptide repeat protein [Thermoguttaceae bacterium]|jgi:tetratricopeptide (TPR) repeat protein